MVNARLGQLRARLRELSMVDFDRIPRDRVGLGSSVTVLDLDKNGEMLYKLVTSEEADVAERMYFHNVAHWSRAAWKESRRYGEVSDSGWGARVRDYQIVDHSRHRRVEAKLDTPS